MIASAIVIASDAPALVKSEALRAQRLFGPLVQVCDGVNDHVEIQAALDAAPDVWMSEGTFRPNATVTCPTNRIIRGAGRSATTWFAPVGAPVLWVPAGAV